MRNLLLALLLLVPGVTFGQHQHPAVDVKPASLATGLGPVHYPVSTASAEAQKFFDQGLAYIYAFNHEEAVRSFKRAAELDPQLAMARWELCRSRESFSGGAQEAPAQRARPVRPA